MQIEEDGKTHVKPEPSEHKAASKFTDEEDICICKACVSCSTDPISGAEQKGEKFWKSVHEKTCLLYNQEAEVAIQNKRPWDSIRNRFQKTLAPSVQKFNAYYKQAVEQNESGWTKEMYIEAAKNVWLQIEGKPYKHGVCTRILHQMPKYNPMIEEEEEDGKPAANPVGRVMGDTMERPTGTKKAKKQKILDKLDAGSVASSQALDAMARTSSELAKTMARRQQHDGLAKRAELCIKLGKEEKAMEMIQKMEEDDSKPLAAVTSAAQVPANISVPNNHGNSKDTSQLLKEAEAETDGDIDKEENEEDSHHSSQPSDDSRIVKNNRK